MLVPRLLRSARTLSMGALAILIWPPGAEGVGRAATGAFVFSFVAILIIDLMLGISLQAIYDLLWPEGPSLL